MKKANQSISEIVIYDFSNQNISKSLEKPLCLSIPEEEGRVGLNLALNELHKVDLKRLVHWFSTSSRPIALLDLGGNQLGNKSADELADFFQGISTVTNLSLDANALYKVTPQDLRTILGAMQHTITTLDLSRNNLLLTTNLRKTSEKIIAIGEAMPPSVQSLSLKSNNLYGLEKNDLIIAFSRFSSERLKVVNLAGNYFNLYPVADLIEIFEAFPKQIETLQFDETDFSESVRNKLCAHFKNKIQFSPVPGLIFSTYLKVLSGFLAVSAVAVYLMLHAELKQPSVSSLVCGASALVFSGLLFFRKAEPTPITNEQTSIKPAQ